MNSQENDNLEQRLQQLESEIEQPTNFSSESGQPLQTTTSNSPNLQPLWQKTLQWFSNLPTAGKIVVIAVAVIVGFGVLRTVFQLVTALLSLAVLGVVLYLVYKFLIAPQSDS